MGDDTLPPGRFISGITETSLGNLMIIGVCIPWFGSRTSKGAVIKRARWQDHGDFLAGLGHVLDQKLKACDKLVLVGDFNQRISGKTNLPPRRMRTALQNTVSSKLTIISSSLVFRERHAIDHIALSPSLKARLVTAIDNLHGQRSLSDHFSVAAELA